MKKYLVFMSYALKFIYETDICACQDAILGYFDTKEEAIEYCKKWKPYVPKDNDTYINYTLIIRETSRLNMDDFVFAHK